MPTENRGRNRFSSWRVFVEVTKCSLASLKKQRERKLFIQFGASVKRREEKRKENEAGEAVKDYTGPSVNGAVIFPEVLF